ncbi:transposase [Actinacidiphila cocklensis]|uniref:Mutator family transposase n=1 Tax=Actinacidiphila cocklensis TaxID=887465 RepID=A0A9W4GQ34_9ACTN|nr:transposase [Actinacidiphila cocklensis]
MILSLYARGMTTRDISTHLKEVYGSEVSPALVSKITDVVADEITSWQNQPLDDGRFPLVVATRGDESNATRRQQQTADVRTEEVL